MNSFKQRNSDLYLPIKKTLYGSSLKSIYSPYVKSTFRTFNEIEKNEKRKFSTIEGINDYNKFNYNTKTYKEIIANINSERNYIEKCKPIIKRKLTTIRNLYKIHLKTEMELFDIAKERRIKLNPLLYKNELKREERDRKHLEHHRLHSLIKNKLLNKANIN